MEEMEILDLNKKAKRLEAGEALLQYEQAVGSDGIIRSVPVAVYYGRKGELVMDRIDFPSTNVWDIQVNTKAGWRHVRP